MDFDEEYALSKITEEKLEWLWRAVNARRLSWDSLLWQIPLLFVTGEAFLFIIILSDSTSYFSRNLSSLLAMIVSIASVQVFARYRASELHDAEFLAAIEKRLLGYSVHGQSFRSSRNKYVEEELGKKHRRNPFAYFTQKLNSIPSFPIWMSMFIFFFGSSVLCLVLNILDVGLFHIRT